MGRRPPGGPSDDQLKRLADTLNEIGRQTIPMGIRLAPHPHIWGPLEREQEVRRAMDLTDPNYVWMTVDTGHIVLGGSDAAQIISDYFPRVAEVHLKDTYAKYRGNTSRQRGSNTAWRVSITIWAVAASTSGRLQGVA